MCGSDGPPEGSGDRVSCLRRLTCEAGRMMLEQAIACIRDDELVEVTPG